MTIAPSGTRLHPVESHSLPFRRVFPCGECGGRCDEESPSAFLLPVKSPPSSHPSPKRHPSRPHRLPNPLHINGNKSPDFSNSFKRVMLDPSNDSHRTICPVFLMECMPAGNRKEWKPHAAMGDTSLSEGRQGGPGRPRRGCFGGRRGVENIDPVMETGANGHVGCPNIQ